MTKINMGMLLALNPAYAEALAKGESWALEHAARCQAINDGQPEGFRRKFDGTYRRWCGGACPFEQGCVTCALPEDEVMARENKKRGRMSD